ncbi:MAG: NAD-dependent epimerase/dehydratase family protein [Egibacteraceae bacterium]
MTDVGGARVLVTGACGFIGRAVVRELAAAGARVVAAYRRDTPTPFLPRDSVALDLLDHGALVRSLDGVDLVVHLAARSGGIEFQEARHVDIFAENHALTKSVLAAATQAGVTRVFLASSAVVYRDGAGGQLLDERAAVVAPGIQPVSGYAWSKLTDEALGGWYGLEGGLEVVTGRFGNVYGPGGSPSTVVHALVRRALAAPTGGRFVVWGDGTAVRSFLYLSDAARAAATVLERGVSGQVYNLDSSIPTTIHELARTVRDAVASFRGERLAMEFDRSKPTGPARRVPDSTKLAALGFAPRVSLGEGVHATVIEARRHAPV